MVFIKNKKGAVELSLNLIIMLVIGLIVLGLVIGFVTGFLHKAEDNVSGQISDNDKPYITKVLNEPGNFVLSPTTVTIVQGSNEDGKIYMKIRNPTSEEFVFDGGTIEESGNLDVLISPGMIAEGEIYNGGITVYGPPVKLSKSESEGYALGISVSNQVPLGVYYATFNLDLGGVDTLYQQTITIQVE